LLEYLRQQNWIGRPAGHGEYVGLCPLHEESRPSFYVNTHKDVFYCHGCGQGGDLMRFLQLSHHLAFHEGLAYLHPTATRDVIAVLEQAATFYQHQLDQYPEALGYLWQRGVYHPTLIRELGIGYAPGGNLRRHLTAQGYSFAAASALPSPIVSCPAARAACMHGKRCAIMTKSSWSKDYSTMARYGRPVFRTRPARWAPI
jgi:hypothetical protein